MDSGRTDTADAGHGPMEQFIGKHGQDSFISYIGWDCALSDKGWCLIEGNWGQFDSESADKEGIKQKFDSLFD